MTDYIYETSKSSPEHTGVIVIQDGSQHRFPAQSFSTICRRCISLLCLENEFLAFITMKVDNKINKEIMSKTSVILGQIADRSILYKKSRREKICLPDYEYFLEKLEKINNLAPNSAERAAQTSALRSTFYDSLTTCIENNSSFPSPTTTQSRKK